MKDSRIGAYGAIGINLMLALKCVVLASLPIYAAAMALVAAHPLSRLASTALIWRLSYARADGKAMPLAQSISGLEFCIAAVTALLPVVAMCAVGWLSWKAIITGSIAMVAATLWLAGIFLRRIGGYTGDCLGALQQVAEVVFYLGLAVVTH
jgi:adenosylcobinamide-GDP ribazoletransferase